MKIQSLNTEDVNKARREVDDIYDIYKQGSPFTKSDFEKALKKVSRHMEKPKSSPKPLKT